ncbi:MAG: DUF3393 domain-containing protein, partial [Gammaproteobacteria bacterium]|nr:DUF3393 domain-containing protein [Gammaproteobacteria bacterium]
MRNQTLSFIILLMTGFTLVLVASYLSHFQSWVSLTQSTDKSIVEQQVSYSGIRSISSLSSYSASSPALTETKKVESQFLESSPNVSLGVKKPAQSLTGSKPLTLSRDAGLALKDSFPIDFPVFVEYEDELLLEFPESFSSQIEIKRAISRVLLSSTEIDQNDLVSLKAIQSHMKPLYYKKIQNQYGRPIRYPAAASQYADYLLKNHSEEIIDGSLKYLVVHIPLV